MARSAWSTGDAIFDGTCVRLDVGEYAPIQVSPVTTIVTTAIPSNSTLGIDDGLNIGCITHDCAGTSKARRLRQLVVHARLRRY